MKLRHDESKQAIEVRPEYVDMYRSQGWAEVKSTPKSAPSDKPASK